MKKMIFAILVLTLLIPYPGPSALGAQNAPAIDETASACVEGNNRFAFNLFQKLVNSEMEKGGNIFVSPFSISGALAMTYAGARGETQDQMKKVLQFNLEQKDLHPAFSSLFHAVNATKEKPYVLKTANALWGQVNYTFLKSFTSLIQTHYGGGFFPVDFVKQTEAARIRINRWVENQTEEKIKDILAEGDIDALTRLVLTNAIYFKGDWQTPFKEANTQTAPFHPTPDTSILVPLMTLTKKFAYMERNDKFQALELPYAGDDLAMVIFLPSKTHGFANFAADFSPKILTESLAAMRPARIQVFLPKFKTKTKYYLKDILSAMGMGVAFTDNADFSDMTGNHDLKISKVIHQAFVEVNEKGTEAAAATAVVMALKSMPMPPKVFRADRPFAFLIRHKPTGSILFMGKITNPLQ